MVLDPLPKSHKSILLQMHPKNTQLRFFGSNNELEGHGKHSYIPGPKTKASKD